jgi:MFS transporter, putative metabolite:H+ symporter
VFGMSSAHGFGGIGEIISPIGLALIVGSSNILKPDITITAMVPCFLFLGAWPALARFA